MADDRLVAGIELGGTKGIALIARGTEIIEMARVPTTRPDETLPALAEALEGWRGKHGAPSAIGIASFGPIGLDRGRADFGHITATPKSGWAGTDIAGFFMRRFGLPVGFDTDVNGAALAEHRWGAAQGCDVAVYITIGTGVGGGLVVGGKPVHGLIHPEIGHVRVRRVAGDDFAGVCPFHGDCLEGLVSGPALAVRAGMPGDAIGDDDPVWTHVAADLAEAMAMLMVTLSPRRILIGGGVFQHRRALLPMVHAGTVERLGGYLADVDLERLADIITMPGLGDRAGPLGAVALAYSV